MKGRAMLASRRMIVAVVAALATIGLIKLGKQLYATQQKFGWEITRRYVRSFFSGSRLTSEEVDKAIEAHYASKGEPTDI